MSITVITPTCDRPVAFGLLERWMARQTVQPDEWIVADGGRRPVTCTRGQIHLYVPSPAGAANFASNLLHASMVVHGDMVVICEDDDHYRPTHLAQLADQLARPGIRIAGDDLQRYYNIRQRKWRIFHNKGASLCQTGFSRVLLQQFRQIVRRCLQTKTYGIDGAFWASQAVGVRSLDRSNTVLGIKGLPGQVGLGVGHRPQSGWTADPGGKQLRAWIGEDADCYSTEAMVA